jgi:hypothetical protein
MCISITEMDSVVLGNIMACRVVFRRAELSVKQAHSLLFQLEGFPVELQGLWQLASFLVNISCRKASSYVSWRGWEMAQATTR